MYLLNERILATNATQSIITLAETKFSRRDLIECFHRDQAEKQAKEVSFHKLPIPKEF